MAAKEKPLKDRFAAAKGRVEKLSKRPSNEQLLQLYALYKQASEGDVSGDRPGTARHQRPRQVRRLDPLQGPVEADEAMKKYVALVDQLEAELG